MALPSPLPDQLVEFISARFRLLSEPMRVRILDRLRDGQRSVGELVEELGSSQQNISRHLTTLYAAGVLDRRKEGNRVVYWVADRSMLSLCEQVCGSLEQQLNELRDLVEASGGAGTRG